jgi:hypothetical protein
MRVQLRSFFVFASVFASLSSLAQATTIGINIDPAGTAWDRGEVGTAFAQWDTFSSTTFMNDAAGSSFGVVLPELDQSGVFEVTNQGAGLYNVLSSQAAVANGDVIFAGSNAVNFTLTGSTDFAVKGLTLQIKRPSSTGGLAANFSPTITFAGGSATAFDSVFTTSGSGDTSSDSGAWSVTTWYWSESLASNAVAGDFVVSFANAGLSRGIDTIALDAGSVAPQAVPEPATWASLAGGLAFLLVVNRRRLARR